MIKLRQAVVVEGKYDKIRLESLIDALIITTEGFSIFKDKEKLDMLRCIAEKNGLIIMTDSDSAGFLIRNHLVGCIPKQYIKHVYIPDVLGKEKRKDAPSKEGKLGVEGMSTEILLEALERAGVTTDVGTEALDPITKADLFSDGYSGGTDSSARRKLLQKKLNLPERLTTNALLGVLNAIITRSEYKSLTEEINKETDRAE